ncbi:hypothetical protein [Burkholderia gladioli]|uniref:hypothetical protein n=1 Tax=Burkholderia gladioli TaxID=28095 RepID=UPI0016423498|nr:hypothetical protein [Burkholderia gladioli]
MTTSLECTMQWLEHGNDPKAATDEIRACLAKLDAAPAASMPGAEPIPMLVPLRYLASGGLLQ